jgi:putative endonuclease
MEWLRQFWLNRIEQGLTWLDRRARARPQNAGMPEHLRTGVRGEDAAYFFLRRKGYVVVARRWTDSHAPGDIDLIAWDGPLLCMIEVKTRTAHDMLAAEHAVNGHKRHVLRRLAKQYVRRVPQKTRPTVRFDVISVYLIPGLPKEFHHFEAAFGWYEFDRDRL